MSKKAKGIDNVYESILEKRKTLSKKGAQPIIGVDIGSNFIKVVKMKKNNKIHKLAIEPVPKGLISQGRIEAQEPLVNLLRDIHRRYKIPGKDCAVCISGSEIVVRELTFPAMEQSQIESNIRHEISSFLPYKYEDYYVDYKITDHIKADDDSMGKIKILVVAAPKGQVSTYVETFKKAGLNLKYIDVTPNVIAKLSKAVAIATGRSEVDDIAIIDFGAQSIDVSVLHQGNYSLHRAIPTGGEYLTSTIAEKLDVDEIEAEEYKCKTNFFIDDKDPVSMHVQRYFDYNIKEIVRILEFFINRTQDEGVEQIYIMGGGSYLKGLPGYLKRQLGVNVYPLSDALEMFRGDINQKEYLAVLFNAIGATMREDA